MLRCPARSCAPARAPAPPRAQRLAREDALHAPQQAQRCRRQRAALPLRTRAAASQQDGGGSSADDDGWAVEYLVDMECPLRRSEVDALRRLDRNVRTRNTHTCNRLVLALACMHTRMHTPCLPLRCCARGAPRRCQRRISFVDISSRAYSPAAHGGVTYEDAMGAPAARLAGGGGTVRSAEVYGALYGAVGLGGVWQLTRLPGVRRAVDAVFDFWTAARLPLTGRGSLAEVLARRAAEEEEEGGAAGKRE
jgi:hypothetical protein